MNINNIKSTLDNLDINTISPEQLNQIVNTLSGREMELEINRIQQRIEEANSIKMQSEGKIAAYRDNYTEILNEFRTMNVDPKNTKSELLNLCKDLVQTTVEIDKNMPDIESIKRMLSSNNTNTNSSNF